MVGFLWFSATSGIQNVAVRSSWALLSATCGIQHEGIRSRSATSGIWHVAVRSWWALCAFQLPVAYSMWQLGYGGVCLFFSYRWHIPLTLTSSQQPEFNVTGSDVRWLHKDEQSSK